MSPYRSLLLLHSTGKIVDVIGTNRISYEYVTLDHMLYSIYCTTRNNTFLIQVGYLKQIVWSFQKNQLSQTNLFSQTNY